MTLTIDNTNTTVFMNGVPVRAWEGRNENGVKVIAFICRIAVMEEEHTEQFEKELLICRPPCAEVEKSFPMRMIL